MDEQVESLFRALADLTPSERQQYFENSAVPRDVRDEVESLLRFDADNSADFTEQVSRFARKAIDSNASVPAVTCGPYRLVRQLGSGGMGKVYLGDRTDGEIQQKVAIKLLTGHDPGWRQRFLKERQFLASLNHPSIVHVIDAGHTADNRPYLAMEYVEGVPIDVYTAGISLRESLKLFLRVCEAVSHAHRHLIIHRDLKPSNILVDVSGQPKLLDFGIAKLLDTSPDATQSVDRLLTPNYASPEQLRGGPETTAVDVYALGAILYRLLTGRVPYSLENVSPGERERIICDQPPLPPRLGKELDSILLTALRKEPERRYNSVRDLADDIERFLDNRPVRARPDTRAYRMRKYVRRHWAVVLAAAIAVGGISTGGGVAFYQAHLARWQFNQVRDLANRFLFDFHDQIRDIPGTLKARQMVVSTALEYLNRLANQSGGDRGLQWELAVAFGKVAAAQGSVDRPSLSQYREALISYDRAFALARPLAERRSLDAGQRAALADLFLDAAKVQVYLRGFDAAVKLTREAVNLTTGLSADTQLRALTSMAKVLAYLGDLTGSVSASERMVALTRQEVKANASAASRARLGLQLSALGVDQHRLTRLDDAQSSHREAVALLQSVVAEQPGNAGMRQALQNALTRLGDLLGGCDRPSLDKFAEAASYYERGISALAPVSNADPNDRNSRLSIALAHVKAACSLSDIEPRKALEHAAAATRLMDLAAGERSELRAEPRIQAANAYRALHEFATAERELREAVPFLGGRDRNTQADLSLAWARLEIARGNREAADHWFARAISDAEALYQKTSTPFYAWELNRVLDLAGESNPASAPSDRQRILNVWAEQSRHFPAEPYILQELAAAGQAE